MPEQDQAAKAALGSPEWLSQQADMLDELHNALGSIDEESAFEDRKFVQGLRDASINAATAQRELDKATRRLYRAITHIAKEHTSSNTSVLEWLDNDKNWKP